MGLWSLQGLNGKGRASKLTHEVGLDSVLGAVGRRLSFVLVMWASPLIV